MKKKRGKKNILYLLLGFFVIELFLGLFKNTNKKEKISEQEVKSVDCEGKAKEFIHREEEELKKFIFGRESFGEFFRHSGSFLKDLFIPHENNDHKPKILRTGSLLSIAIAFLLIKLFFSIYLFFAFPDGAYMSENLALQVFELINKERIENALPELERDPELARAAQAKAQDMINNNYFAHFGPDGKKPWEWIRRTEYDYIYAGENLAMNFNTANAVHAALMKSESHKKNILSDKYKDIGLAMIRGMIDGKETNVLVQTFAHPRKIEDIRNVEAEDDKILDIEDNKANKDIEEIEKDTEVESFDDNDNVAGSFTDIPKGTSLETDDSAEEDVEILDIEEIEENNKVENFDDNGNVAGSFTDVPQKNPLSSNESVKKDIKNNNDSKDDNDIAILDIDDNAESATTMNDAGGDILRGVAMQVREIEIEKEPAVMAERNYLEIDNNTLVSIKAAPEIIGTEAATAHKKVKILNMLFVIFAVLIGILLALNIFIRLKIQHKSVIVQAIFTIIFISGLFYIKCHYLEENLSDILLM